MKTTKRGLVLGVVMLATAWPGRAAGQTVVIEPTADQVPDLIQVPAPGTWFDVQPPRGLFPVKGGEISMYPWYDGRVLPTAGERKMLEAARVAAEADAGVVAATRNYEKCYAAADEGIRALMRKNPRSDSYAEQIKAQQQVHDTIWVVGQGINSLDILLPDPHPVEGDPMAGIMLLKFSGFGSGRPAADSVDGIRRVAEEDPAAKVLLEKVRDAYWALDEAARAAMAKNAEMDLLMEKHTYLFYGRRDLGFATGGMIQI
jgi:hypothetical protein